MKTAIIVNADDIKKILADYFNVPESNVTKAQNEYIIITEVRNA